MSMPNLVKDSPKVVYAKMGVDWTSGLSHVSARRNVTALIGPSLRSGRAVMVLY